MATRIGHYTVSLPGRPRILASAAVVGKKEGEGPLGQEFDAVFEDATMGEDSWEKAESCLQKEALQRALDKAALTSADLHVLLAGDLLDQCTASAFGLRDSSVPLLGQYGACSTMAQTLCVAAMLTDSGASERAAAVTSSHFCSAERQFRYPLAYGGQRTPTAQWTATAAGCALVGQADSGVAINDVCIGRIVDLGITDANNMGAAMAPADGILTPYESEIAGKTHPKSLPPLVRGGGKTAGFDGGVVSHFTLANITRGTQSFKILRHRKDAIPDTCYIQPPHILHQTEKISINATHPRPIQPRVCVVWSYQYAAFRIGQGGIITARADG